MMEKTYKYISIALSVLVVALTTYIIFFKEPAANKELQRQNKEILETMKRQERFIHDLKVERGMRVDTVKFFTQKIRNNEKTYYNEIAYVLSADYRTTDSLYRVNSHRFDSLFQAGFFNP